MLKDAPLSGHDSMTLRQTVTDWSKKISGLFHGSRPGPAKPPASPLKTVFETIREPLLAVIFAFVTTTALAQPFYVPSGSMEPTLQIGDALIATKYDYGYSRFSIPFAQGEPKSSGRLLGSLPRVGDIVIFRLPRDTTQTYIKRAIGLPGDRIQMREGRLWINGREAPIRRAGTANVEMEGGYQIKVARYIETLPNGREHYIFKLHGWDSQGFGDNTGVFVVPANHIFVMGDNRDDSLDSRFSPDEDGVGFVPARNLMAHAQVIVGSYDFLNAHAVWTWLSEFRISRFFSRVS